METYLDACGRYLPGRTQSGLLERNPEPRDGSNVGSLYTESTLSGAEMAVRAGIDARVQPDPQDGLTYLIHASTYHQGQDLSPISSYIAHHLGLSQTVAFELRQMSNGTMSAIAMGRSLLECGASRVYLSSADRNCLPGIDRWRTDRGTPYGDGAGFARLQNEPGKYRLLAHSHRADNRLHEMHLDPNGFSANPFSTGETVDYSTSTADFIQKFGVRDFQRSATENIRWVVADSLNASGVRKEEVSRFILPHFGQRRLRTSFLVPLDINIDQSLWAWTRTVGHVGAADQLISLSYLSDAGLVNPGDFLLMVGVGAGFTWSALVLEVCSP